MKRGVWVVALTLCVAGAVALGQSARRRGGNAAGELAISKVNVAAQAKQIDEIVLKAAKAKGLEPKAVVDDLAFLRRVSVDLIGRVPTYGEIEAYQKDAAPERRAKAVKRLINSSGFVDRMTIFFGDMMNIRSREDDGRGLDTFVKKSLAANKPYDVMVREILTANGSSRGNQAVGFFIAEGADPFQMAAKTSHVFMGTRIHCAQCHNHPFDEWKRQQFYGLAAYFGKTKLYFAEDDALAPSITETKKNVVMWPPADKAKDGKPLDPSWPFVKEDANAAHLQAVVARRAKLIEARATDALLGEKGEAGIGGPAEIAGADAAKSEMGKQAAAMKLAPTRDALADLLTSVQNKLFAQSMANRLWAEFVGKGIVTPVDDFRADNLPSNAELLTFLGDEFIALNYDLRAMVEMIVLSETYQRSRSRSSDKAQREALENAFVAAPLRRMIAEQMYDSLVTAGHLRTPKWAAGENLREVTETILVARPREMKEMPKAETPANSSPAMKKVNGAESGDVDLEDLLSNPEEKRMLAGKEMYTPPPDPMQARRDYVYEYQKVKRTYDFNPQFGPAARIASPAPSEHFLRQFGQSGRLLLGEKRDAMPTMRQSLILLNGSLANEAARVGTQEPMWKLLDGNTVDAAVRRAYLEIYTREPSAEEMTMAKELIESAATRAEGMGDLRWAMLNSNEFRYLP